MTNSQKQPYRILFVCLGNICRSPAAEGIMRHRLEEAGLADVVTVDSAGIGSWHVGQLPDERMRRCGRRHGYDFSSRARQFGVQDFSRFDVIIGMDDDNTADLRARARTVGDASKVLPMARFLRHHPQATTIPDPYYGQSADFDHVVELLEDACEGLMDYVVQRVL